MPEGWTAMKLFFPSFFFLFLCTTQELEEKRSKALVYMNLSDVDALRSDEASVL